MVKIQGQRISEITGNLFSNGKRVKIRVSDGIISDIIQNDDWSKPREEHVFIAPGLIDNQINGYIGIDFTEPDLTVEKVKKVTRALWKKGITTYLPTLITNSQARLMENFKILAKARSNDEIKASIPGFHLEGPYISPKDGFRGAHSKKWIRKPDLQEFNTFLDASDGNILQITLAPELEGAVEFIQQVKKRAIIVALGHHNGSSETIAKAVDAGASTVTHLGNGCANLIDRHNNPLWPQLADDRLMASIIVDGRHLTKDEVQTFYKAKGLDNIILTSDITKFAGMPPGEYNWGGRNILLTEDDYIKDLKQDVLVGSALTLDQGIENIIRFTGCSLAEAIRMATLNPANLYGFTDREKIEEGKRADLIVFEVKNGNISINQTIVNGEVVFKR